MEFLKVEEIDYICKLLFNTYKIPISFFDHNGNLAVEHSLNEHSFHLFHSKIDLLITEDNHYTFPIFKSTTTLENFFLIQIPSQGSLLVGPVLYSKLSEASIKGLSHDLHEKGNREEIIQYYQALPVLSNLNFINMSMVFYYMLFQQQLDLVELLQKNKQLESEKVEIEQPDVEIAERRQNIKVHQDPLAEKKFFDCIREGKTAEVINAMKAFGETGEAGVLSKKSHLRSQKNLAIAGITLATRAALDGGLYPEIAYTLSDLYIQNMEEIHDSKGVDQLLESAFLEFSQRVEQSKREQFSAPIYACQNYIFTHLYEDITLNQLAEIAAMSPSYLSALFKQEVGISISGYIQRAKINEAKNLITYTSHSLTEISSLLNFHDQSYFTKIFKKFAGVTPKQFKSRLGAE
ncbi:helix-turn-helix domain-containing protein [Neobacillus niacini]|uniref:helix-turn-helix domain-containing protein n=1 Tax=Neobacillus niacini TaxID=86668 RepID=UPI003983C3A1